MYIVTCARGVKSEISTVAPLYVEIPQPLYETIPANAETECTTEGLGMEREYDTPDQTVVVVTSDKGDQNNDNGIPGNVSHGGLADHISHSASSASYAGKCTCTSRGYCDGSVDLVAGEIEGAQIFEDAQAQALKVDAGVYEIAQVYEQVPNVNTAHLLSNAGVYERAQVYEGVSNVNIAQIPSQVVNYPHSENINSEAYERVWYGEKILQLIRGVMQPYERIHYSEQIWRTIFGEESVEL